MVEILQTVDSVRRCPDVQNAMEEFLDKIVSEICCGKRLVCTHMSIRRVGVKLGVLFSPAFPLLLLFYDELAFYPDSCEFLERDSLMILIKVQPCQLQSTSYLRGTERLTFCVSEAILSFKLSLFQQVIDCTC